MFICATEKQWVMDKSRLLFFWGVFLSVKMCYGQSWSGPRSIISILIFQANYGVAVISLKIILVSVYL